MSYRGKYQDDFNAGLTGAPYTGNQNREAYDKGRVAREEIKTYAKIQGNFLLLIMQLIRGIVLPVLKFLVINSGFIFFAILSSAAIGYVAEPWLEPWLPISLLSWVVLAYGFYCLFEYMRGHMIQNRKANAAWRIYYLLIYIVKVICPLLTTIWLFQIVLVPGTSIESPLTWLPRGLYTIPLVIICIAVYKGALREYDFFSERSTKLARWAFDIGIRTNYYHKNNVRKSFKALSIFKQSALFLGYYLLIGLISFVLLLAWLWYSVLFADSFTFITYGNLQFLIWLGMIALIFISFSIAKRIAHFNHRYAAETFFRGGWSKLWFFGLSILLVTIGIIAIEEYIYSLWVPPFLFFFSLTITAIPKFYFLKKKYYPSKTT